jgi:VWFA-related protein
VTIKPCFAFLVFGILSIVSADTPFPTAQAQEPSELREEDAPLDVNFRIRTKVELTTIQVNVRNKKGEPIRNLKKEDFTLYEDGKRQEILSLDEVDAESASSSLGVNPLADKTLHGGKTVLMIFYDYPELVSRDAAMKFVGEYMQPRDIFAVATYRNFSMKILQSFTSDKQTILSALSMEATSEGSRDAMAYANAYIALDSLLPSIAAINGQKNIFLFFKRTTREGSSYSDEDSIFQSSGNTASMLPSALGFDYRRLLKDARQSNVVFHAFCENVGCYNALARESGGVSLYVTSEMETGLAKLNSQLSNYYVLGFQSNKSSHDGAFRKIVVKTKAKGSVLQHAEGYQDRLPVDALSDTATEDRLLTALASPVASGISATMAETTETTATDDAPLMLRPVYFYDSPRMARVLVSAEIHMGNAAFRKKGGKVGADLDVMGVAYAESGAVAARFSETLPAYFDKGTPTGDLRRKAMVYRNYFRLAPGHYRLKFALSDGEDVLGTAETETEIPPWSEQGIAASSLVVIEQTARTPESIRNIQARLLEEADPLIYAGSRIEPSVTGKVAVGAKIPVLFRLYNLPPLPKPPSSSWNMLATAKLVGVDGNVHVSEPISLEKALLPDGKTKASVGLSLFFPGAAAGKYQLVVEVSQPGASVGAGNPVRLETDLELVK